MSDAIPPAPTGPDPSTDTSQTQPAAKPRWPASRVILLVLLVLCLGALAKEYLGGRMPWQHAQKLIAERLPDQDSGKAAPPGQGVVDTTDEDVHKMLDRQPDEPKVTDLTRVRELVSTGDDAAAKRPPSIIKMVDVYRFGGAIRTYELRVEYIEGRVNGKEAYILAGMSTATPYHWETH